MKNNCYSFKFKCNFLFNYFLILFLALFVFGFIYIIQSNNDAFSILWKLLILILFETFWGLIIKRKLEVMRGDFYFSHDQFIYSSLSTNYYISYDEIEFIDKCYFIDNSYFLARESYYYEIKIINSGKFVFKYYDDSLDDAVKMLAKISHLQITEKRTFQ